MNEKVYKIKMVRQISQVEHGGEKNKILCSTRDYHGTTIKAYRSADMTKESRAMQYGSMTPGFVEVPRCLAYRNEGDDRPDLTFAPREPSKKSSSAKALTPSVRCCGNR